MYKIRISNTAIKDLESIVDRDYLKISDKINSLAINPRPIGSLKLTNEEGYRIRSGKFRILYLVNDKKQEIIIYRISHRKEAYR